MNALTTMRTADAVPLEHSVCAVPGVRCAACIGKIERGLAQVTGVQSARVNFTTRRVVVAYETGLVPEQIREAIAQLGFDASPIVAQADQRSDTRQLVRAMAVAGFAAMNIMLLSVSVWSGAAGDTRELFHWLSALIAMPTVAYAGRPFFASAWNALRRRRTNMDVPISIGVMLATGLSLFETVTGGPHAYFDGAVMLLFFLLIGRVLDSVMRDRARSGVEALLRQTAPGGSVLGPNGTAHWIAADDIAPGMILLVAAGERIAADGVIEQGQSALDRSIITGESHPEHVRPGSEVLAGTVNLDAPLHVRVTRAGEATTLADVVRLMDAAAQGRSRYVRIADRAARLYAPAVHALAAASFAGWMIAGAGWHHSLLIAVAVLIITCPCALGLAVPAAQVVAAGALMRRGVLVKDGSALERLAEATTVRFDKTGTLTLGQPELTDTRFIANPDAPVALALAQASRHPLSKALVAAATRAGVQAAKVTDLREIPGLGVEALFGDRSARLGKPDWVGAVVARQLDLATAFSVEGSSPVVLAFADPLRPDAKDAISALRQSGLTTEILSGDRLDAVVPVAAHLNVIARASLSPSEKFAEIERVQATGEKVLMVGDGINDGPALAAGHVSIAPASATDVGQTAADLVFMGDSLMPVPVAIRAARHTMRIVRENFAIAIAYNILAVPLAIAGLVTPLIAAVAMSLSSVIVVGNALRLSRCAR
jgi:Cu2+-exporting ATPase